MAQARVIGPSYHLRRLVDFAEPRPHDVCLDVAPESSSPALDAAPESSPPALGIAPESSPLASALRPRVGEVTVADAAALPDGPFTLVTARLALAWSDRPAALLREMLDVCGGRLILADLVRACAAGGDRAGHLHHPAFTATRTLPELIALVREAGGDVRRLDVFSIERPAEPWLARAADPDRIRRELIAELDGGPRTGLRPRLIGQELWFTQSWAYIAAEPAG